MTTESDAIELTEGDLRILRCIRDGEPCAGSPADARATVAKLFRLRLIEIGRAVTRDGGHDQHRIAPTDLGRAALVARSSASTPSVRAGDGVAREGSARGRRARRGRLVLMAMIMVVVVIPDAVALETLSAATAVGLIALLACVGLAAAAVLDRPLDRSPGQLRRTKMEEE